MHTNYDITGSVTWWVFVFSHDPNLKIN